MAVEETLRELWAATLGVDVESISYDSNFFELGGNSLSVLALQAAAYGEGFVIGYGQIFETPILQDLAAFVRSHDDDATPSDSGDQEHNNDDDDLVGDDTSSSPSQGFTEEAERHGIEPHTIEETYLCTPLQQGMVALSIQDGRMYRACYVFRIPDEIDTDRLRDAWRAVVHANQSLRTRIIATAKSREAVQVVLKEDFHWTYVADRSVKDYSSSCLEEPMAYGSPLSTFHLFTESESGPTNLAWTVHHATFDGWALSLILQDVKTHYDTGAIPQRAQFSAFARHIRQQEDQEETRAFWRARLEGFNGARWPVVRQPFDGGNTMTRHRELFTMEYQKSKSEITFATLSRAGWGLVLSAYTSVPDVVFGTVVYGRNRPVPGVTEIIGPTMATVPVRIQLKPGLHVASFLQDVQRQAVDATDFEHYGIQKIAKLSGDAGEACAFQTLLVVHSTFESSFAMNSGVGALSGDLGVHDQYHPYALVIDVWEGDQDVRLDARYDDDKLSGWEVQRLLEQYAHVIKQLGRAWPGTKVDAIGMFSSQDNARVQEWNASPPGKMESCVHELVEAQAIARPEAMAVSSWDGELTYQELDTLSTRLAAHLFSLGVGPGSLVPICLDKSLWVIVAMLGVLKAGAAYVPLDAAIPAGRLEQVVEATGAAFALSDAQRHSLLSSVVATVIQVSTDAVGRWPTSLTCSVVRKLTDVAYVMFTSGSTGRPKGVVMEHQAVSTSVRAHGEAMRFGPDTRALHFVSLGFDVSVAETLTTLVHGGCVCIPNEEQRLSHIADFIRSFQVNWAFFTPSVISLIEPNQVPSLKTLVLGGEPIKKENIDTWADRVELINGYGPTEACVFCVSARIEQTQPFSDTIGRAIGSTSWVVSLSNEELLAAVGSIGELWVEGPQLARGYLNNDEATASAFIVNPPFATRGVFGEEARRFYRTGDLVRYSEDGSMRYCGRKDTQVKVRGQRVELGEVEHAIQNACTEAEWSHVVVDAVKLDDSSRGQMLVAFVEESEAEREKGDMDQSLGEDGIVDTDISERVGGVVLPASTAFLQKCQSLKLDLEAKLPAYMMPQALIPVQRMPFTSSHKVDRRKLQEWAAALGAQKLADYGHAQTEKREPSTHTERALQGLWEKILRLPEGSVGANDDLFQLGGDSIDAMRLVAAAAEVGLTLTVGQIFRRQQLWQLAEEAEAVGDALAAVEVQVDPFSLLGDIEGEEQLAAIKVGVAEQCGVSPDLVEDVYPCTPLQEGLMALAVSQPGAYVARHTFRLDANVEVERLKAAWSTVSKTCEILRTRIVHMDGRGPLQVVLRREEFAWEEAAGMLEYVASDKQKPMGYGTALTRTALVTDRDSTRYFVWTGQHSTYDGWSVNLIVERVKQVYRHGSAILEELTVSPPSFSRFIKHLTSSDDPERLTSDGYWRQSLAGWSGVPLFPKLSSSPATQQTRTNSSTQRSFALADSASNGVSVTHATVLRTAWAIVLSRHANSDDVVFGSILSGRNASVPGISTMVGPTITTVPLRVHFDSDATVVRILQQVEQIGTDMIPYEQAGLHHIQSLSSDAKEACQFQSILAVQPVEKYDEDQDGEDAILTRRLSAADLVGFHTYPLVIECRLNRDNTTEVEAQYDDAVLSGGQAERLLQRFEHVVHQLTGAAVKADSLVGDVDAFSPEDAALVRAWNASAPPVLVERCVHEMFEETAHKNLEATAVSSWEGELTYRELNAVSDRLAARLVTLGAGREVMVPICFEKSMWVVVAMLAVLKSGAAFVPLDEATPLQRLETIASSSQARILLCSPTTQPKIASISHAGLQLVAVSSEYMKSLEDSDAPAVHVTPSSAAYVIYTSGSTGVPKGVVVEHGSYCTSAMAHGRDTRMDQNTRALQFSSYAFDAALPEILTTLLFGGTVCIPSDEDRLGNLPEFVRERGVNWALLTPSVIRQYSPSQMPGLGTVVLGGEAMTEEELQWATIATLINAYGPSECSVIATANTNLVAAGDTRNIGRPVGCIGWVANEHNVNRPATIGVAGELVVQGPTLARGYLNDEKVTASTFISRPAWIARLQPPSCNQWDTVYRTGDLVRYDEGGSLVYLGRKDTQVKVRGQRVELSEVEHHMCTHESVDAGVVLFPTSGSLAGKVTAIIAFTRHGVAEEPRQRGRQGKDEEEEAATKGRLRLLQGTQLQTAQVEVTEVRQAMSEKLSSFMVPVAWLVLESMPLNTSGKLDRARITKWVVDLEQETARVALVLGETEANGVGGPNDKAVTPTEGILQEMCSDILGLSISQVSMARSFLHHGGDSITAIQLTSRCRAKGMRLSVQDILRSQTLSQLAMRVGTLKASKVPRDEPLDEEFPLSPIQRHLFALSSNPHAQFNQSFLVRLTREKAVIDVARAVEVLVRQHSMLRARFSVDAKGHWKQRVTAQMQGSFAFNAHDIQSEQPRAQIASIISGTRTRMNIKTGPVFAVDMFTVDGASEVEEEAGSQFLFLDAHHLVVDLVSWRILLQQLGELLETGRLSAERPVPFQVWNRLQADFAERALLPEAALPFAIPPADLDFWGIESKRNTWGNTTTVEFQLDIETTKLLMGDANVTLNTEPVDLFIAALLHSFRLVFPEREHMPTIFNEGHGREPWDADMDVSGTVGWFTTLRPVTVSIHGKGDLTETIRQVKDARHATPSNGWAYFASRHLSARGRDVFGAVEAVEVMFNYLGRFQQLENKGALLRQEPRVGEFERRDMEPDAPRFGAIDLSASVDDGCSKLSLVYSKQGRQIPRILEWAQHYEQTLIAMAASLRGRGREFTVSDFPLLKLTQKSLQQLVHDRLPELGVEDMNEIEDIYPCSPIQEGMLVSQAKMPGHYNTKFTFEAISPDGGVVDTGRLKRAWADVVDRHAMLRTVFIEGATLECAFAQVVLKRYDVNLAAVEQGNNPVIPRGRPAHQFTVSQPDDGHVECQLDINHILIDGASLPIILRDLVQAYQGALPAGRGPLYYDYIAYLSSYHQESALAYWRETLAGLEPCHFPRLPDAVSEESLLSLRTIHLDLGHLAADAQEFCATHNVTLSNVIHAAWAVLLRSYTGSEDVCFGYLTSGRDIPLARVEDTLGPFINVLTARLAVHPGATMNDLVTAAKDAHVRALPHQSCSLAKVQHELGMAGNRALFNTAVSVQARLNEDQSQEAELRFQGITGYDPTEVSWAEFLD